MAPPPLRNTHPRKRANATRKIILRQSSSTSSSNGPNADRSAAEPPSLSTQVRALERANAALLRRNDTLLLESAQQQRRIEALAADTDRQRAEHAADRSRRIQKHARTLGDLAAKLIQKQALEVKLADEQSRRLDAEQRHGEDAARQAAAMRVVQAQRAHHARESRIHRCAAQVSYVTCEGPDERRRLISIIKRCRLAFTGSEAPPPPPSGPASPELQGAADAAIFIKSEQQEQQQQQVLVYTPQREVGQPLTPESLKGDQSSSGSSYPDCRTPRREGLRPRRCVDSNGSPWNLRTGSR